MAITWSPIVLILDDVTKPNDTSFTISASSDDIDLSYSVFTVISHDMPNTSFVNSDENGVYITGNSLSEFTSGSPILYMENGIVPKETYEPLDIVEGDDVYQWKPDQTISRDATIIIKVEFFDVGDLLLESEQNTYTLTIINSWDAHKASLLELMERLY